MNPSQEALIKKLGEQSQCYSILHRESEVYYKWLTHFTSIPVIVLSTVAGSANFIFSGDGSATTGIGVLSIFVGILQTLASYFRHAQLSEAHRICAIAYNKLFFLISSELALPQEQRMPVDTMMQSIRSELERLQEIAPPIPKTIVDAFKKRYSEDADVSRPQITNGLERIIVFRPPTPPQVVEPPPPPPPTPEPPSKLLKPKPSFKP